MRSLLVLLSFVSTSGLAQVQVQEPWSRATPPGAKVAGGFMTIRNQGAAPDRLVSASSPVAARVETHMTEKQGDVIRMREVKGYEIPAKGGFELQPGGAHLMLVDIRRQFKEGEKVPVVLRFEKAGEVRVELEVRALGAPASKGHGH